MKEIPQPDENNVWRLKSQVGWTRRDRRDRTPKTNTS